MTETKTTETVSKPNIATMSAAQLDAHIEKVESTSKRLLTTLRALARAKAAEEAAE